MLTKASCKAFNNRQLRLLTKSKVSTICIIKVIHKGWRSYHFRTSHPQEETHNTQHKVVQRKYNVYWIGRRWWHLAGYDVASGYPDNDFLFRASVITVRLATWDMRMELELRDEVYHQIISFLSFAVQHHKMWKCISYSLGFKPMC